MNQITFEGSIEGDGECFVFEVEDQNLIDDIDPPFEFIDENGNQVIWREKYLSPDAIFKHLGLDHSRKMRITILVEEIDGRYNE